jgi:hypothetical protein
MSDTLTEIEIKGLIDFGKEIERRMLDLKLKYKEVALKTARADQKAVSLGIISDICRVGRGDRTPFRLSPEKAVRIAEAVEWNADEALHYLRGLQGKKIIEDNEQNRLFIQLQENAQKLGYPQKLRHAIEMIVDSSQEMVDKSEIARQRATEDESQETGYPDA